MTKVEIRRVRPGDERVWLGAVVAILDEEDRDGTLATEAEVARALMDSCCILLLAFAGTEPVGLLSAYVFPDVAGGGRLAYLYDIEVLESHQRAGAGAGLIRALESACGEQSVKLIWAGTEADNIAARRTFERTGAELEGDSYAEYEWNLD